MTAAFSFGPLAAMTELVVAASPSLDREGTLSRFTTSGGVAYFQRPRRSPRSWTVSRVWQDQTFIKYLERAAHGLMGDVFLYDRAAARRNMVPSDLAAVPGSTVVVDGTPMGAVGWEWVKVPVLAGRVYTISCWSSGAGSPLLATKTGETIGALPSPDAAGLSQLTFTPQSNGMLKLSRDTQVVSGVRVHEGIPDGRFYATAGTPCRVAVENPTETYQMITDMQDRVDYSVTLHETGRTGYYA